MSNNFENNKFYSNENSDNSNDNELKLKINNISKFIDSLNSNSIKKGNGTNLKTDEDYKYKPCSINIMGQVINGFTAPMSTVNNAFAKLPKLINSINNNSDEKYNIDLELNNFDSINIKKK